METPTVVYNKIVQGRRITITRLPLVRKVEYTLLINGNMWRVISIMADLPTGCCNAPESYKKLELASVNSLLADTQADFERIASELTEISKTDLIEVTV